MIRKNIEITGIINDNLDIKNFKILLEAAGFSEVNIKTIPQYDDWLVNLPKENIPGLNIECQQWIRYWCNGGGDESNKILIIDALETLESDVPDKLADAIYNNISGYSKSEYEAMCLTIEIIDDSIEECIAEIREKANNYEEEEVQ